MKKSYRWTVTPPRDPGLIEKLSSEINVPQTITRILVNRGIDSYAGARMFFRPEIADLHDPFLMDGMNLAVDRVLKALELSEKILVFGDYDVDGTSSAAMMVLFLRELGADAISHIPDRVREGYGLSATGIDRGADYGTTLLIAIDCGITAVEQVEYARTKGMDVIICDHHEPADVMPDALAVLDPLKPSCSYPFKFLCGCGVGFKLVQGVSYRLGKLDVAYSYLDFATMATTADIVPLIGENRVITRIGLLKVNTSPRPGMKALIRSSGVELGKITTGQIVFVLAPRINAVGRMGDATRAVELLTCTADDEADRLSRVLEEENINRRKVDEMTFLQAQERVDRMSAGGRMPAIVLYDENWHPGVIGIVASRLTEKYYRPSIMLTSVDGVARGSARSIIGFDIHNALKRVGDKVIQFGGHKYAAGLAVELERIDEFRDAFNAVVDELMTDDIRTPELKIDAEIGFDELTPRFFKVLKEFAPYGPGNMRPVFLSRKIEAGSPRIVGKNHLRFKVEQGGLSIDAIGFNLGDLIGKIPSNGTLLDIVYSVDEHEWPARGAGRTPTVFPQLKIKDLRKHTEDA
ncbi:MAG TPA: single-stranded-DNA-specific exonuclease RecJ [Bacteroidota bacterium]|nr:single-stranded-DNA-specific exonuclease RecJ [Bacteroidota bacterium]